MALFENRVWRKLKHRKLIRRFDRMKTKRTTMREKEEGSDLGSIK
jgi:hypothetical protein